MPINRRTFLSFSGKNAQKVGSEPPDERIAQTWRGTRRRFAGLLTAAVASVGCFDRKNIERWGREQPPQGPSGAVKDWSDGAHRQGYTLEVQTRYGAVGTPAEYRFHVISWRNAGGRAYAIPATLTDPEIALFVRNSETVRDMVITGRYAQLDTANYAPGLGLDARAIRLWVVNMAAIKCTVRREENEIEIRLPPAFDALEESYRSTVHAQEDIKTRLGK